MKPLYKNQEAKTDIMSLYEEKLNSLQIDYKEIDVKTSFGNTRVIKTGNENGKPIVLLKNPEQHAHYKYLSYCCCLRCHC